MTSDRIILEGMQFYGYHGSNVEERDMGQPFVVDLEAEVDLQPPGRSDQLEDTVNYTHLYRISKEVVEGPPRNLIEAVAENIAQQALEFHSVAGVRVRVKKTRPPIKGSILSGVAVEVYRTRG